VSEGEGERLQKVLAAAGAASRRGAVPLVQSGRVRVNGEVVTEPGARVDPAHDRITLDGRLLRVERRRTYLADKPRGVICTSRDPQGRTTLVDWAKTVGADPTLRLYGVGRLDYDSEGLILLTNDGALAQKLGHPSHHAEKEYRVWLDRLPDAPRRRAILRGIEDRGELLRALRILDDPPSTPPSLRLALGEGRNRHIRRLMSALGLRVLRLRRIRIGPLTETILRGRPLRELPPNLLAPLLER
jgi:23S rRNA pseudouridine2605 synthase